MYFQKSIERQKHYIFRRAPQKVIPHMSNIMGCDFCSEYSRGVLSVSTEQQKQSIPTAFTHTFHATSREYGTWKARCCTSYCSLGIALQGLHAPPVE